jgi:chromate transporter
MLWHLFWLFFKVGCLSFGGGYAIIPILEREVTELGWMRHQEFTNAIAVAAMAPGPVANNAAVFIGYQQAGILGVIVSVAGIILPSLILLLLAAAFLYRIYQNGMVNAIFYGLKPVIMGLIAYAALRLGISNHIIGSISLHSLGLFFIFAFSLLALLKLRWHPVGVLLCSGLLGIVFYI